MRVLVLGLTPWPNSSAKAWYAIVLNRFKAGYAGQDELAAAAETGEEVGRNPVDDDDLASASINVFIQLQRRAQLAKGSRRGSGPYSHADRS